MAVIWSEPSDGKGGPAMPLVSSAHCEAALLRYHGDRSVRRGIGIMTGDVVHNSRQASRASDAALFASTDGFDRFCLIHVGKEQPFRWSLSGSVADQLPQRCRGPTMQACQPGKLVTSCTGNLTHSTGVTHGIQSCRLAYSQACSSKIKRSSQVLDVLGHQRLSSLTLDWNK